MKMSNTTAGTHSQRADPLFDLSRGTVIGRETGSRAPRSRPGTTYVALKRHEILIDCTKHLNAREVVALVSGSATQDYVDTVSTSLGAFICAEQSSGTPTGLLVLPTSGSTGTPKLTALPAANILTFINWAATFFQFGTETVSLSLSPWNFDVSLLDTWAVLQAGGTVVGAESPSLLDTSYIISLLRRNPPTIIQTVPTTLDALLTAVDEETYCSVRDVIVTGGIASRELRKKASQAFPCARFHNIYGATEINDCLISTMTPREFAQRDMLPLGKPLPGCDVFMNVQGTLVHFDDLCDGCTGELHVRTPWMSVGYLRGPQMISIADPKSGLYPMKDLAILRDGELFYEGRVDRTVKIRGQRLNLDEVENKALLSGIAQTAYVWLEGDGEHPGLHLAYTLTRPARETKSRPLQLRLAMAKSLPAHAMPNYLHALKTPPPVNANGKPDLNAIRALTEGA